MKTALLSAAFLLAIAVPFSNTHAESFAATTIITAYGSLTSGNLTTYGDPNHGMHTNKQEIARIVKNDVEEYVASGIASEALSATMNALSKQNQNSSLSEEEMIDLILNAFNE